MQWSKEQLEKIPEVYQDFMLILRPVIDSRDAVLKISGIPLGQVFSALRTKYQYEPQEVRELAQNLREGGLINQDDLGFLTPTGKGEALIRAIAGNQEPVPSRVPELPPL